MGQALPADVARGARERIGADLAELLAESVAEEWSRAATSHVSEMRAGRFSQGDPVEFRHPETDELLDAMFEYEEAGVARLRYMGRRVEVPAASVKSVPESCGTKEQFALMCRAASRAPNGSR